MIKAVLFDFDGVLTLEETGSKPICDYISQAADVDPVVLKKEYISYTPELLSGRRTHADIWDALCTAVGRPIAFSHLRDAFLYTPMNHEMLGLLARIKARGYITGMVTDNRADRIHTVLEELPWGRYFDAAAISAEVGSGKVKEPIFLRIFELLAVRPDECVFIDNLRENLVVPRALGVHTIYFDFEKRDAAGLKQALVAAGLNI